MSSMTETFGFESRYTKENIFESVKKQTRVGKKKKTKEENSVHLSTKGNNLHGRKQLHTVTH